MRIVCLKQGNKYGPEYVNILYKRLKETTPSMTEFVCYTDNRDRINKEITVQMLPPESIWGWWWKPWILAHQPQGYNLFIDLDMLIVGDVGVFKPKDADLNLLSNGSKINSSIIGFCSSVHAPWAELKANRDYHVTQREPYGDQEIFELCADRREIKISTYDSKYTAWLGRADRDEPDAKNFNDDTRIIVCKGPRNPHDNLDNKYVKEYWK